MACCCCLCTCLLFGAIQYIYPLIQSIIAISSGKNQKEWLYFWAVFAILLLAEHILFFLPLIPGWNICKTLIALWLYLPNYQGARYLFEKYSDLAAPHTEIIYKKVNSVVKFIDENEDQQEKSKVEKQE